MNNELDRRAAFWDFFRREFLDASIRELDKHKADKWLDDDDIKYFGAISITLRTALYDCLNRYHHVLGEQIQAMKEERNHVIP